MSTGAVVLIIVAAAIVVVAVAVVLFLRQRRQQLRERFGSEYDRAVHEHGSAREAEHDLRARAERHDQLHIVPLDHEHRERYSKDWTETQARFVDQPERALAHADELVQHVMQDRGYPVGDFDQQVIDLSVEHGDVLDHYRSAHLAAESSSAGEASTEDLRQGMVHYRALFTALLEDDQEEADGPRERSRT